jgi:effector-binding domain-containing protein
MPIGLFARTTRLSVRVLRNYDRGPPAPTDRDDRAGQLPGCLLAATVHEGGYDEVEIAYQSLGRWIAEHDRALAGPAEERYLTPPAPGVRSAALRTEIAWPVRPAAGPARQTTQETT